MKKKMILKIYGMLMCLLIMASCQDRMDEHYESPDWLKGSAWEVLEARGNYAVFLKGVELAGFKPILEGKSLVTVMAPSDSAFARYLAEQEKSSIEDFSESELKRLIGFHLMYYSYDKDMLENFRPLEGDGATDEEKLEMAGLYYKHRTRSYEAPTTALDSNGVKITVYHNERLLPVFSHMLFDTKGIDPAYNYAYFFPDSKWTGTGGFNVANASVDEYSVVTDNGYIYMVDRVLKPLETIYTELQKKEEYSRYLELYDRYSVYELDDQLTTDFGNGTDLYRHYHSPLPSIACEWPVTDWRSISMLSYQAYSVFAPSNAAFDNFFDSYWKPGGYTSLSDVNMIAMVYLLYNSVYNSSIVFPEQIANGDLENSFDMLINFDVENVPVENRVMCENGVLYGLNELDPPGMFTSVTGPAFRDKDLSYYLYMLYASEMLVGLSSRDASLTVLIPDNDQMKEGGISLVDDWLWSNDDGDFSEMSSATMTNIVNLHTVTGGGGISISGTQVLRTNIAYTYWYLKDGKITTSVLFNNKFMNPSSTVPFTDLHELTYDGAQWSNGKAYTYDSQEIFRPLLSSSSVQNQLAITRDESYPYYRFSQLLRDAGLASATDGNLPFLGRRRCAIFVPTNDVLGTAIGAGKIPGIATDGTVEDQDQLADYLACYFVPTQNNGMTTYPYVGSGVEGEYNTMATWAAGDYINSRLIIIDNGQSLSIQLYRPGKGNGNVVHVVPDYDYFPFAFEDGGVHYVNGIL